MNKTVIQKKILELAKAEVDVYSLERDIEKDILDNNLVELEGMLKIKIFRPVTLENGRRKGKWVITDSGRIFLDELKEY
ncbi:MAG: hypothetical protein QG635_512 [Bacteroidota bacterium]|nr:hypothetical protein [Bacteroidota bacterium]